CFWLFPDDAGAVALVGVYDVGESLVVGVIYSFRMVKLNITRLRTIGNNCGEGTVQDVGEQVYLIFVKTIFVTGLDDKSKNIVIRFAQQKRKLIVCHANLVQLLDDPADNDIIHPRHNDVWLVCFANRWFLQDFYQWNKYVF